MAVGLRGEINIKDVRIRRESIKLADLSRHFLQRELADRNPRISYSKNLGTSMFFSESPAKNGATDEGQE
jgi:hypothetical protein